MNSNESKVKKFRCEVLMACCIMLALIFLLCGFNLLISVTLPTALCILGGLSLMIISWAFSEAAVAVFYFMILKFKK